MPDQVATDCGQVSDLNDYLYLRRMVLRNNYGKYRYFTISKPAFQIAKLPHYCVFCKL